MCNVYLCQLTVHRIVGMTTDVNQCSGVDSLKDSPDAYVDQLSVSQRVNLRVCIMSVGLT